MSAGRHLLGPARRKLHSDAHRARAQVEFTQRRWLQHPLDLIEDWDMWLRLSERFWLRSWKNRLRFTARPSPNQDRCVQIPRHSANRLFACSRWRSIVRAPVRRRNAVTAPEVPRPRDDILMTEATNSIHEGNAKSARANILDAFRFRPFRTVVSLLWLLTPRRSLITSWSGATPDQSDDKP